MYSALPNLRPSKTQFWKVAKLGLALFLLCPHLPQGGGSRRSIYLSIYVPIDPIHAGMFQTPHAEGHARARTNIMHKDMQAHARTSCKGRAHTSRTRTCKDMRTFCLRATRGHWHLDTVELHIYIYIYIYICGPVATTSKPPAGTIRFMKKSNDFLWCVVPGTIRWFHRNHPFYAIKRRFLWFVVPGTIRWFRRNHPF